MINVVNSINMKKYLIGFIVAILIGVAGLTAYAYVGYFRDVPSGQWFSESAEFMFQKGIMLGNDQRFRPGDTITRVEIGLITLKVMAELGDPQAVCIAEPQVSDIGSARYYVSRKYQQLGLLGGLFTYADCGKNLANFFGVDQGNYTHSSTLYLRSAPSAEFRTALEAANYICSVSGSNATTCNTWQLRNNSGPTQRILELRPFMHEVYKEESSCVTCLG